MKPCPASGENVRIVGRSRALATRLGAGLTRPLRCMVLSVLVCDSRPASPSSTPYPLPSIFLYLRQLTTGANYVCHSSRRKPKGFVGEIGEKLHLHTLYDALALFIEKILTPK